MSYRRFWFQVDANKYDLMTDAFMSNPQGLGFKKTYSSYQIGSKEIVTSEKYEIPTITGEINFYIGSSGAIYEEYQSFLKFINQGLTRLYYQPPNSLDSYFCDGIVIQLDKAEIGNNGLLTCPITFKATTMWRNSQQRTISVTNTLTDDKGKYYDLERDYSYSGTSFDNIEIVNRGYEPVGIEIEIKGTCTDPKFSISQNGDMYGAVQILGTYDYVYINSRDGEEEIHLERNGSTIINPISYQNLALSDGKIDVTFLKIKTGASYAVFYPQDFDGEVTISWFDSFISV